MFPLTADEMDAVGSLARELLEGAEVRSVGIPARSNAPDGFFPGEIGLNLKNRKNDIALKIRVAAPAAISVGPGRLTFARGVGAGWMQGLKKLCLGATLSRLISVPLDRAIRLEFAGTEASFEVWCGLFAVAPACVVSVSGVVRYTSDPKRFPVGSDWKVPEGKAPKRDARVVTLEALNRAWDELAPTARKKPERKRVVEKPIGKRFPLVGGFELIVGGNAAENHLVTFRVARGRDLWLHLDGGAGAHGVVPLAEGQSLPLDALTQAAEIVANQSLPRGWDSADVAYTLRKHVRPAPGGKPGRVLIREARSLRIKSQSGSKRIRAPRP